MQARFIYTPHYDFSLLGLERLHPFDAHKFSRAWAIVQGHLGAALPALWLQPEGPVSDAELLRVHTSQYLQSLRSSAVVAKALELWPAKFVPNALLQSRLLIPMRLAVQGTILAAQCALEGKVAMNFAGGYHHAFADHGEGFCIFADVPVAIEAQRAQGRLRTDDTVIVIDLDAHRGNGFEAIFASDPAVHVLDVYNFQVYPGRRPGKFDEHPFSVAVRAHLDAEGYLNVVRARLDRFLEVVGTPKLAFYNAGTDIVAGDPLGHLLVSAAAVAERDRLVVDALAQRDVPTVIVTSGGYSRASHELVAQLALYLAGRFA